MSDTSKTIVLTGLGGYEKLKIEQKAKPTPDEGQVLVHIQATGINFAELMIRMGSYGDSSMKLPLVLGFEGSGVVCEVGTGVDQFKVGDRVLCILKMGLWREYAAVNAANCFPMPEEMTFEEAAAIPINYTTAYHMLFEMGNLKKGKSCLVHMVAGGVGVAATQLIKSVPDTTIFGTCSAAKHETVKGFGVQYPIDYRTQDYVTEVRKVSPEGVDIVLDPLSGEDSTKGYGLLKPLGNIIHFGASNTVSGSHKSIFRMLKTYIKTKSYNPLSILTSNKGIHGYNLGVLLENTQMIQSALSDLMVLYRDGYIKPQIDSVWAFEDVGKAMARMHDRKNIGKVILSPQKAVGEEEIRNNVVVP